MKRHGEPPALVLYDVTSRYFEGEPNELADDGDNRDGKKGKQPFGVSEGGFVDDCGMIKAN